MVAPIAFTRRRGVSVQGLHVGACDLGDLQPPERREDVPVEQAAELDHAARLALGDQMAVPVELRGGGAPLLLTLGHGVGAALDLGEKLLRLPTRFVEGQNAVCAEG
jgi:hypothetical protein